MCTKYIIADVQEMARARECDCPLNNMWNSAVIDFGCVGFRLLLIKFKFSRVKVSLEVEYGPQ